MNSRQDIGKIVSNFVVFDSHNMQAARSQNTISFFIIFDLLFMYLSIHFHNQANFIAIEIYDKAVNYLLPSKVKAV